MQALLFEHLPSDIKTIDTEHAASHATRPLSKQLLKWIGNKQRFAEEIISYFPDRFETYFEPFLGSGAVMGTLVPTRAIGSDVFEPLIGIWQTLRSSPETLKQWYSDRWYRMSLGDKKDVYAEILASYNTHPNSADFVFLCRTCYGGVVRFRKQDGYMSTPCGPHAPIKPDEFGRRVDEWHRRTRGASFMTADFQETLSRAGRGDLVYCDPPYLDSQAILYGAQSFKLQNLFEAVEACKRRGVKVVLSIDGTKKSGDRLCNVPMPEGLFEHEVSISIGGAMLKRFQLDGQIQEGEDVTDRLLLTYLP